MLEFIGSRFN
jgi:hypothetical protein